MPFLLRNGIVFLLFIGVYAASYNALLNFRSDHALSGQRPVGWALPPHVLKVFAGEFKGLAADLIMLDVGAQLGTELVRDPKSGYRTIKKQYDWDGISRLFSVSQALDPSFQQTFMIAQGWLPWNPPGFVAKTQDILKTAAENRLWDWQATHFMGFNTYYFLNQPGEAGKIFLEAAKTPNSPPFLAILGARLAQKGGQTETAIAVMKSMLAEKDTEEPGYADMFDRLRALEGVLALERAMQQYEKAYGHKPNELDDLIVSGILASLPENPYNLPYCMDGNGVFYFDNPQCRSAASSSSQAPQ